MIGQCSTATNPLFFLINRGFIRKNIVPIFIFFKKHLNNHATLCYNMKCKSSEVVIDNERI